MVHKAEPPRLLQLPIPLNQSRSRAIMRQPSSRTLNLARDLLRQHLAQLRTNHAAGVLLFAPSRLRQNLARERKRIRADHDSRHLGMTRVDQERGCDHHKSRKCRGNAHREDLINEIPPEFDDKRLTQKSWILRIDRGVKREDFRWRKLPFRWGKQFFSRQALFGGPGRRQPGLPLGPARDVVGCGRETGIQARDARHKALPHRRISLGLPARGSHDVSTVFGDPSFCGPNQLVFRSRTQWPGKQVVERRKPVQECQTDISPIRHAPEHSPSPQAWQFADSLTAP